MDCFRQSDHCIVSCIDSRMRIRKDGRSKKIEDRMDSGTDDGHLESEILGGK